MSGSAWASQTWKQTSTFGGSSSTTTNAYPLSGPQNLAINQATGNVYVADTGNNRVEEFDASGNFVGAFGGGVGGSGVNTCSTNCQAGTSGSSAGQFTTAEFVAVDNSCFEQGLTGSACTSADPSDRDVYVADTGDNLVQKFDSSGNLISSWGTGGQLSGSSSGSFGPLAGVSVDASGNLIVIDQNSQRYTFDQSGAPTGQTSLARGTNPNGVAVDGGENFYKVNGDGSIEKFDTSANDLGTVSPDNGSYAIPGTAALAIDPATGDLYATSNYETATSASREPRQAFDQYVFDASGKVVEPDGSTCVPSGYGCNPTRSLSLPFAPSGVAISATSGDVYVADPADGQIDIYAPVMLPDVTTGLASNVTGSSATFNGTVDPSGTTLTDCYFDYGTGTSYGQTAPCTSTPSGSGPQPVLADVSGLTAGQTYHFRLVAANSAGSVAGQDVFFGPPVVKVAGASEVTPTSAALNATLNPQNLDTTYHFDYGTSTAYGTSVPVPDTDIGAGTSDVQVSQALSGLQPNTTYHFRVVVTNGAATSDGPDQTFTTNQPVLVDVQPPTGMSGATGLATGSATLHAYLDPQGSDTSFHFEYGPTTAYGSSTPAADAGSGSAPTLSSASISGLAAETTYHYRTIATNALGTVTGPDSSFTTPQASCPNQAFRTGLSRNLPDCRAYEQISPADKSGYQVTSAELSPGGDRAGFISFGAFAGALSDTVLNGYVATRGSDGWSTQSINPPASLGTPQAGLASVGLGSSDLTLVANSAFNPGATPNNAASSTVYLRSPAGSFSAVTPPLSPTDGSPASATAPIGATPDLSHIVFTADAPLLPSDTGPDGKSRLYEVSGATGASPEVRLATVDPSTGTFSSCPTTDGGGLGDGSGSDPRAVSDDGSKIFYSMVTDHPGCDPYQYQVFARVNGTKTLNLSDPSPNDECTTSACRSAPASGDAIGALFRGASSDGSKVFFMTPRQLTDNATEAAAVPGSVGGCEGTGLDLVSGCNLYEYDFNRPAGHNLVDLSAGDTSGMGPQVRFVLASSDDGSHIYFLSAGVLTPQPNQLGQAAQPGALNLYGENTTNGTVSFIGQMCSGPGQSGSLATQCAASDFDSGGEALQARPDLTPDGRYLVFSTYAPLTPDDTNQAMDVYEYDSLTGSLVRVSVGHDGQDANGNRGGQDAGASVPLSLEDRRGMHVVSADGQTIVFATARPLQDGAVNDVADAYEWHQGEVTLVSGAGSSNPVWVPGGEYGPSLDPSGQDIVFQTEQGLLPQDTDGLTDIYDARIGGGFPAALIPPAACSGDACQGPPANPPGLGAIVTFDGGPGNSRAGSPGRARVLTRVVHRESFLIAVRVPGPGRITVTGHRIGRASRTVGRAGIYRLRIRLTHAAIRTLVRRRSLRLELRVGFASAAGDVTTVSVRLTVRPPSHRHTRIRHARELSPGLGGAR